jgi:hypothetical protein
MEGVSGAGGGWIRRAMPIVLSIHSARGDLAGVVFASSFPVPESGGRSASACGFGSCTCLYVAARGFGGGGALAHVHMVYSVSVESVI